MVQMAAIWIISVVAFFVLWALLASVIRKISEKKVESGEFGVESSKVESGELRVESFEEESGEFRVENEQDNQQNTQK